MSVFVFRKNLNAKRNWLWLFRKIFAPKEIGVGLFILVPGQQKKLKRFRKN